MLSRKASFIVNCSNAIRVSVRVSADAAIAFLHKYTRNSSADEIANVNFYDDIVHVLRNTKKDKTNS